ncbi:hypothetical protein CARUB_v10020982mg [Capsella rubella]|uniref:AD domain-containing protein n=1 Tax=Capsella rubella TaxID=81985 RepID=R0I0N3_9BRAS|nr:hypothetical protein CARUB_v10020982mg [Capsella rubella]
MKPASGTVAKQGDGGGEGKKFALGNVYTVKLTTGDVFNGIVLGYDSNPNIVMFDILFSKSISDLQEGTKPKPLDSKTLRMVNANFITELTSLGRVKDPLAKRPSTSLDELEQKEVNVIRDIEKIGFGVTAEAQKIFDAISKTLPTRWVNKDILVMGEVFIRSPYYPDCVDGGTRAANDRVKTVLKQERKKLQLSDT